MRGLYQALAVAAMCLQEQAATRPLIGDVVTALTYLASETYDPNAPSNQSTELVQLLDLKMLKGVWKMDWTAQMSDGSTVPLPPIEIHPITGRNHARESSTGVELGRNDASGGSGRKWGLDDSERHESHRDSPLNASRARETLRNHDLDRERAVAEAKVWGENWRERKRVNAMGSFDGTND
ncbi:RUB-activating enzyme family protein [Hibiscus syriacus]|uniref:RUB-activating enzyme family protein n=1 Tax=Hibiscus syriacus TaxID=106335 RepID=A0A6A2XIJ9_HIBSY|nr:RUB-activating enzyme family protein [Hibiscus syriacus]